MTKPERDTGVTTKNLPVIRHLTARPRLVMSFIVGAIVLALLPANIGLPTRLLIAWNSLVLLYLALALGMMATSTQSMMRRRAAMEDEGRFVALALTVAAAVASLAAIGAELLIIKDTENWSPWPQVALSTGTILSSWSFIHVVFTQHYAHEFYSKRPLGKDGKDGKKVDSGGLLFPGNEPPNYLDFLYFSFTIGVANQTADIMITSREMRRLALFHAILSYLFNTTILALTINIATSRF